MKLALAFLITLLPAVPVEAQKQPIEPDSCLYRIPANAFKRVPVFLEATADSASRAILPGADLFAQSVAFRLRALLGGSESKLAEADSTIDWSRLWGEVVVTLHKDGAPTWAIPEWSSRDSDHPRSALRFLRNAIQDVVASGETVSFPDGFSGDSITFGLSLVHPRVMKDLKVIPVKGRQPVPVFTMAVAWEKSVELTKFPHIVYPEVSRSLGAIGNVQISFAVNKQGRADMETVKEVWPATLRRPTGELRNAYDAFLRAVIRGLPSARFSPAVIGGCVMNQKVVQTFDFKIP